ncbi:MAG: hypothetical protein WCZ29_28340, partial [Mycolicibacterium vanbaalenii]
MSSGYDGAPMVACPHGHLNAWNYKFCGQCGSPIGVVAFPDDDAVAEDERPLRRRGLAVGGAIAAVLLAVIVAAVGFLMTRSSTGD